MLKMAQLLLHKRFSFLPSPLQPPGRREYSWEFLGGWCCPVLQILTLQIHFAFPYYSSFLVDLEMKLQVLSYSVHSLSYLKNRTRFQTIMCKVYTPFQTENHTLWGNIYMYLFDGRVRKYTQFGIFYAKIVQMTPLRLRRESLRLQKF